MRGYSLASFVLRSGKQQLVDDVRAVWAESDRWLLLTGSVGLGKTGLAVSLLLEAMHAGADALGAVRAAIALDEACGGSVDWERLGWE